MFVTDEKLFFKVKREISYCGMPMFETTSGLFITYTKSDHIKGIKNKPIDANLRLVMADNDFKDYRLQEI